VCWFISGTLPKTANLAAVRSIVGPEGNAWRPRGVGYFDVTGSGCDCDTALGGAVRGKPDQLPRSAARWTETKKQRWIEQRQLAGADGAAVDGRAVAWHEYMKRVVAAAGAGPVGLVVHWWDELGAVRSQEPIEIDRFAPAEFLRMEDQMLYQFVTKRK
jgi:hypothetical protein